MPAFGLEHRAAYVVVVATTAIIWSLLVLGIRIFIRLKINGPFGWDDITCAAATLVGITQSGLTLGQIGFGLGQHDLSQADINSSSFLLWLSIFFYYLGSALSILSVCFLIARILKTQRTVWMAYGIAIAIGVWAVAAMLANAFQCDLPHPWLTHTIPRHCKHLVGGPAPATTILC